MCGLIKDLGGFATRQRLTPTHEEKEASIISIRPRASSLWVEPAVWCTSVDPGPSLLLPLTGL